MMKMERLVTWATMAAMFGYFQWQLGTDGKCCSSQGEGREVEFELAHPMGQMQKFMDKLHFAGMAQNWPLAGFYLHELEEQAEAIVAAGVHEGEVDVSALTQQLVISKIEELESYVDAGDATQFENGYLELVERCNSCHQASNHGFIQIKVPQLSMFKNQEFGAQE